MPCFPTHKACFLRMLVNKKQPVSFSRVYNAKFSMIPSNLESDHEKSGKETLIDRF